MTTKTKFKPASGYNPVEPGRITTVGVIPQEVDDKDLSKLTKTKLVHSKGK